MLSKEDYKQLTLAWINMRQRCYNKNHPKYPDYGERGITVCKEWKNNKYCFIVWSLLHGFKTGLSIDRINVNRGYSPKNCRWIPLDEQLRNTRRNIIITHNGEKKCLSEWAREYGISKDAAKIRYHKGLNFEEIFLAPIRVCKH